MPAAAGAGGWEQVLTKGPKLTGLTFAGIRGPELTKPPFVCR